LKEEKMRDLPNSHKFPVNSVKISRNHPQMFVTCGDEQDTIIKFWSMQDLLKPQNEIQTAQVKHYSMGRSQQNDFFAVTAWTSDIKLFRIVSEHGQLKGLQKVGSFGGHKKKLLASTFLKMGSLL